MRNSSPLMDYVVVLGIIVLAWYVFGKAAANTIKEQTAFADDTKGAGILRVAQVAPTPIGMRRVLLDSEPELT